MLKFKINVNERQIEEFNVEYESLFLSPNNDYITGVTSPDYKLVDENEIIVISDMQSVCTLTAQNVYKCGFVKYNQSFEILHFTNIVGILYTDGQYYCVEKNYPLTFQEIEVGETIANVVNEPVNPFITINNIDYEIGHFVRVDGEVKDGLHFLKHTAVVVAADKGFEFFQLFEDIAVFQNVQQLFVRGHTEFDLQQFQALCGVLRKEHPHQFRKEAL